MNVIPFTQAWETAKYLVGDRATDTTTEDIYQRLCNLVYTRAIPQVLEWDSFKTEWTPILVRGDYQTGTITMTNADATVTFSSAALPSYVGVGWKLRPTSGADTDNVYTVASRTDASNLELERTFVGTTASGLTFILYQDLMGLPTDYDRMVVNPRIWWFSGGRKTHLTYIEDGWFGERFQVSDVGEPQHFRISPTRTSEGVKQIQFEMGWDEDTLVHGEYVPILSDVSEYTTGTLAVTNGSQTFTGTNTLWTTNVAVGDYIRVDSDRPLQWYKVTAVGGDTSITASVDGDGATGYKGSTASGRAYTVSKAFSTVLDPIWQNAIIYGTCAIAALNQDDHRSYERWQRISGIPEGVLTNLARAENRVNYGNQRMSTVYQRRPGARR